MNWVWYASLLVVVGFILISIGVLIGRSRQVGEAHKEPLRGSDTNWLWEEGDANKPEPDPIINNHPPVWELVIEDMRKRNEFGIKKYGTPLQPFNKRDFLTDMYQEELDKIVYLRGFIYEEEHKNDTKD